MDIITRHATRTANEVVCGCAVCGNDILQSELNDGLISDEYIYKCGKLSYIELYHTDCGD